jgi:hypothetical protein
MSTPSGKPFDPFDISAYAPKKARQRSTEDWQDDEQFSAQQPSGSEEMAPTTPFTANREWSHPTAYEEHPADSDQRDVPMFDDEIASEPSPLEAGDLKKGAEHRAAEETSNNPETTGAGIVGDADRDDPFGFADVPELPRAAAAPEPPPSGDDDIERLESSLRWLRREDAAGRLPRAAQLPPVQGLRPTRGLPRKGETYINGYRLPRSLEPEFVPPPPIRARRDHLRGPMRIVIASVIAAPIAYYFTTGGLPDSLTHRAAKFASLDTNVPGYAPASVPAIPQRDAADGLTARSETIGMLPPVASRDTSPAAIETVPAADRGSSKGVVSVAKAAVPPRQEIAPAPAAAPAAVDISPASKDSARAPSATDQAAAPSQPVHRLAPEDIKLLVQQGEQFVAAGDLVTARVVFQRAAEAGDAMGALAMGATYDPIVLAKLGVRGIEANVEKARSWYQKARDFGSAEAPRRLEMLANR